MHYNDTNPQIIFEPEPKEQGPWCTPRSLCAADRYIQTGNVDPAVGVRHHVAVLRQLQQELKAAVDMRTFNQLACIEVFYSTKGITVEDGCYTGPGFYWQSCQPGCLPDSDPSGPFETRVEAVRDALDRMEE